MSSSSQDRDRDESRATVDDDDDETSSEERSTQYVEEKHDQSSLLQLAEWKFLLTLDDSIVSAQKKQETKQKIVDRIVADSMAPYLEYLQSKYEKHFPKSDAKLSDILQKSKDSNAKELSELEKKIVESAKQSGDIEVRDAMYAKANFYFRIGAEKESVEEYEKTLEKTIGSSSKIDVVLAIVRVAMAFDDVKLLKTNIARAKEMVERGGDWERKNLLLVYEALYHVIHRDFSAAAKLFMDAVATFTCYELTSYDQFIFYTVITAIVAVDRVTLKERVISTPEVLSVLDNIPHLRQFLFSIYKCQYRSFFEALIDLYPRMQVDRYFSAHLDYYVREIRVLAYQQFLASYRSVTLSSMAEAFGVSRQFLDAELFRFISAGRVNAKIDRVIGVVEATRKEKRNTQYSQLLKQGDHLLHRIQKLTKVITY